MSFRHRLKLTDERNVVVKEPVFSLMLALAAGMIWGVLLCKFLEAV